MKQKQYTRLVENLEQDVYDRENNTYQISFLSQNNKITYPDLVKPKYAEKPMKIELKLMQYQLRIKKPFLKQKELLEMVVFVKKNINPQKFNITSCPISIRKQFLQFTIELLTRLKQSHERKIYRDVLTTLFETDMKAYFEYDPNIPEKQIDQARLGLLRSNYFKSMTALDK